MPQPIVHTLIIAKNPNSQLGPEIALAQDSDGWVIPGMGTPTYSHTPEAALAVLGGTVVPGVSCQDGEQLTSLQTGMTPQDLVYVDIYEEGNVDHILYAILLRKDRMPLRFTVLEDCEFKPNWFLLNDLPEGLDFYIPLVKAAALKLKGVDSDSQRAINAARTIRLFADSFGHSADPIRPPKQADKRAAAWVNTELAAGTLNKKAVSVCLENFGDEGRAVPSGDKMNRLYRLAWRVLAAGTHKKAFS